MSATGNGAVLMGKTGMGSEPIAVPRTVQDLGVRKSLVVDLALKILYLHGELLLVDLADYMGLSFEIVTEVFEHLRKEQLCEVKGMTGGVHRIASTSQGKARALESLAANQYTGPVPVSLDNYVRQVRAQSVRSVEVHKPDVERAFNHLVLRPETLNQLGVAIVSGRSIFLYGPSGTGKTTLAISIPSIYDDHVLIPYALEVDDQIITVFDPHLHDPGDEAVTGRTDGRWVRCRRPRVVVGGELKVEMLDLQFNLSTKFYSAPLALKANNGVLVVDDFGRQRVRPEELLNRWIVPLDRGIDFLTLGGGKGFEVPFDVFVVFATNLNPLELADETFLRRIRTKLELGFVAPQEFHEVFRRACKEFDLVYEPEVVDEFIASLGKMNKPLRPCYPREIVQHICWAAGYEGVPPHLDSTAVAQACRNYFLSA
jgi:predicted ATPase with chaperone activity